MSLDRGKLVVRDKKGGGKLVQVQFGDKLVMNVAQGEVSQSLLAELSEFNGQDVEFERIGGQPKQLREPGGTFIAPSSAPSASNAQSRAYHARQERRHAPPPSGPSEGRPAQGNFHNPYNFIPAPPRDTGHTDLGDHAPAAQDVFDPSRYTGVIRVRLVANTPLLVPDTENVQVATNGHKTFPLRRGSDNKPLIPASSVRGMLRSAYEAVTNSRLGRFSHDQHRDRLAFRMDAREGLRLIPARIEGGRIQLLTGTSAVNPDGKPSGPMYAAWLPRYQNGRLGARAVYFADGALPQHGDEVECWLELVQHHRWDRQTNQHRPDFQYWAVRSIAGHGTSLGRQPVSQQREGRNGSSRHEARHEFQKARGWVCITNASINRKHDERVFFNAPNGTSALGPFPLTEDHRAMWRELIANYQSIHQEDLRRRDSSHDAYDLYLGPDPGRTAWSRHIYTSEDREASEGTLCYVRLNAPRTDIEAIFPVMIARELYKSSTWDLLDPSLRPASDINQLSPADRVFGWVHADADRATLSHGNRAAARGLLRIAPATCDSSVQESVRTFPEPGVPLAILSMPKPQQGRFYVAASRQGEAQKNGLTKAEAGYATGKGLRGRKIYPHQRGLPTNHWDDPIHDRTQHAAGGHFQEYHRPQKDGQEERDDQNRSILGWVKPGAEFTFEIHVHNMSKVELGALLWLLRLPDGCHFRLGGGKPLGFGSVRLMVASCDVRTAESLGARYASWCDESAAVDPSDGVICTFKDAVMQAYALEESRSFDDIPFIRAFVAACAGHADGLPVCYPRTSDAPSPDGESFKWFVANERTGARYALGDLASDPGLPVLEAQNGRGGRP